MVDNRDTLLIDIGTVYGPAPTRNAAAGVDSVTCASPTPCVVVAGAGPTDGVGAAAGGTVCGAAVCGGGGCGAGCVAAGAGCGGTTTVPGTGVVPGGAA